MPRRRTLSSRPGGFRPKIGPLEELIEKVLVIQGVRDLLGPVLPPMIDALSKLGP